MKIGIRGIALLQVWLLVFGVVGFVFMMGSASVSAHGPYIGTVDITPYDLIDYSSGPKPSFLNTLSPGETVIEETVIEETVVEGAVSGSDSYLSKLFGLQKGGGPSALATGLQWAVVAYFAGTMIGDLVGLNEDNSKALGAAMAAGVGTYVFLDTYTSSALLGEGGQLAFLGANPPLVGLGVGVVVFALMYKDVDTEVVTFNCMPWQAPIGGDDCEICNDEELPCSEYRCRSLGQNCEIVNVGTTDEKCVNVNPRDVNPPVIAPKYDALTAGYEYRNVKLSPPGPGFEIVNVASADGCLKAFTPLEFGLTLNEPGQCKIDFNHTEKFDDMVAFVGGSNLFSYNHSEAFSLPGAKDLSDNGFVLENGKDLTFFVRCRDKNGNENSAEYAINFCIDPSPDNTAPKIEATSIVNGGCVAEEQDTANVVFYTNEPANCRWDFQDQDYDLMANGMDCENQFWQANAAQLFGCSAELTGIARDGTTFYVRCKDQPGKDEADRNENRESFEFNLRGSVGLVLRNLKPNETIFSGVSPSPIELYAETLFGCDNGRAICAWSDDGTNYIQFFDTDNEDGIHTQRLDLVGGEHKYFVRCVDAGGNLVEDVASFRLDIDVDAPVIARVYEEGQMLKIVTVRNSECSYSHDNCDFMFGEGIEMPYGNTTVHVAEWDEKKTYYIKCRDEFRNEDADCSIVVRPTSDFI